MTDNIYTRAKEEAFQNVSESIMTDFSLDEFDWDQLINLIIEEDSPLQDVLSQKTVRLAMLYAQSRSLVAISDEVDKVGQEIDVEFFPVEELEDKEEVKSNDDFADFEDLEE